MRLQVCRLYTSSFVQLVSFFLLCSSSPEHHHVCRSPTDHMQVVMLANRGRYVWSARSLDPIGSAWTPLRPMGVAADVGPSTGVQLPSGRLAVSAHSGASVCPSQSYAACDSPTIVDATRSVLRHSFLRITAASASVVIGDASVSGFESRLKRLGCGVQSRWLCTAFR